MHELILASQSPRRKQLLEERGFKFRTFPIEVSEIPNENLNLNEKISDLARQKAQAAARELKSLKSKEILILAADTVVVFKGQILGKPKNTADAIQTLSQLSGNSHQVITGFCLWDLSSERFVLRQCSSQVEFYDLSLADIKAYVQTGEPMDKAGSYGIQGEARQFVKEFSGSYENIVGLPVEQVEKTISENGWTLARRA